MLVKCWKTNSTSYFFEYQHYTSLFWPNLSLREYLFCWYLKYTRSLVWRYIPTKVLQPICQRISLIFPPNYVPYFINDNDFRICKPPWSLAHVIKVIICSLLSKILFVAVYESSHPQPYTHAHRWFPPPLQFSYNPGADAFVPQSSRWRCQAWLHFHHRSSSILTAIPHSFTARQCSWLKYNPSCILILASVCLSRKFHTRRYPKPNKYFDYHCGVLVRIGCSLITPTARQIDYLYYLHKQ